MNVQYLSENRLTSSPKLANLPQVLKPGQIIQGKIVKLYPNQKAQIQLGNQKMIAQLEASLSAGGRYHFQVQPSDDVVHLRVIGDQLQHQDSLNIMELLQQLGLRTSKSNAALVQSLLKQKIPFTKEQLQRAFQLRGNEKNNQQAQQTIKSMIAAGLPMTSSVYQAMASARANGMTDQMTSLLDQLRQNPDQTSLQQNLINRISQMIEPLSGNFLFSSPKEQFLSQIQHVLRYTGLNYENQLANNQIHEQQQTIKSMLLQLIQQSDGTVNERSQQLLYFMNGMQIQSVNETANALQANLQIPGQKMGLPDDLVLEFSGHKTEDGKINPDSCRILFYLDLANLSETIIDMHIQKRTVMITIYNDQKHNLAEQSAALKPMLKDGLASIDYQLSTVTFKPIHEKNQSINGAIKAAYQKPYQGVDYRI